MPSTWDHRFLAQTTPVLLPEQALARIHSHKGVSDHCISLGLRHGQGSAVVRVGEQRQSVRGEALRHVCTRPVRIRGKGVGRVRSEPRAWSFLL